MHPYKYTCLYAREEERGGGFDICNFVPYMSKHTDTKEMVTDS